MVRLKADVHADKQGHGDHVGEEEDYSEVVPLHVKIVVWADYES